MLLPSWFRSLRHPSRHPHAKGRSPCRLQVEPLEDRCTPAAGLSASLVADLVPGTGSSYPVNLTNVNGTLYFAAQPDPEQPGAGLWKSDGTAAGTTLVKAGIFPASGGPIVAIWGRPGFTPMNGSVFFATPDGLWKTDGTTAGTVLVHSVKPATVQDANMVAANGKLFFAGDDGQSGLELWVSDGTTAGTKLVKDIYSGTSGGGNPRGHGGGGTPNSSSPQWLTSLNGRVFFAATNGKNGHELWTSDGTSKGTRLVKDIVSGAGSALPRNLTVVNGILYFGTNVGLWKSDGTSAGTVQVKPFSGSGDYGLTSINGTLFFAATEDATQAERLWKSDGTTLGTVLVGGGYDPKNLTNVNGTLFFVAYDNGLGLWKSDGTTAGTMLLKSISDSINHTLTNVNGRLYFNDDDGVSGSELWQSDGTPKGTVMVQDIYPGSTGSSPWDLVAFNNKLYFAATDPDHGRELWDPPPVEPPQDYLLLDDLGRDQVLRYNAANGAFVDTFVPKHSGGMNSPWGILFGPHDGNLYVSTGMWGGPGQLKAVLRYDGTTGAFIDNFAKGGDLAQPLAIIFGPDGNLYVADGTGSNGGRVARFDGRTGAYLGDFVPLLSGGLRFPGGMVFGPSGRGHALDLYVSSFALDSVLRYDGTTGEFLGEFVASGTGGLSEPEGLTFGPDGNLYVASLAFGRSDGPRAVLRFQGPSGSAPGAFIDEFIPRGAGGLETPLGVLFGPDGNGDGSFDLYVSNTELPGGGGWGKNATVKRYDGVTGTFIDTFVTAGSGGLDDVQFLTFTETDPVTLAYRGGDTLTAASMPASVTNETLAAIQVQPLLTEALIRWQSAGVDTSRLDNVQIQISNLDRATLGLASGHTIWLDDNAAGWGWFVDPTPWDDAEFTTLGNALTPTPLPVGERQEVRARMDLLSVLMHEVGHLLGYEHGEPGASATGDVVQESLSSGIRLTLRGVDVNDYSWLVGLPGLPKKRDQFRWWQ